MIRIRYAGRWWEWQNPESGAWVRVVSFRKLSQMFGSAMLEVVT